ncbi:MAG: hypothetical protein C5B55_08950 [Blastocatellia bacterium]|nr:MAG: hypothetical protein C5B55_08950 [Blastocatellia bacterium]
MVAFEFDSPSEFTLDTRASAAPSLNTSLSEEMNSRALILLICVLLAAGCHRGTHSGTSTNSGDVGPKSSTSDAQAKSLLEKGKQLYRSDQDSEAADAFRQALQLDPDLADAHFRLGLAYEALNKQEEADVEYKKAVESFKKYLEKNPDDAEAHYDFGQTYAALHQFSDATREYRQAIKLKKDDSDMYYDLGAALTKLAQYDEAVAAFSKSLELDPDNYRAADALDEAREGVKRIQVGRKHQEDLLKKQKEDELKKAGEPGPPHNPTPANN